MYRLTTCTKHIEAIASPGPTSTPAWTSPESTTTQVIVFGIITSVLSLVAIYFSYRQLQATRLRNRGCPPPTNEFEADVAGTRTIGTGEGPGYVHLSEVRVLHWAALQPSRERFPVNKSCGKVCRLPSHFKFALRIGVSRARGKDWDELVTDEDWEEHDVFGPPTCPDPSCKSRKSELYVAGDLSVCLDCRSIISSATSPLGHTSAFPYLALQQESELRLLLLWPQCEDEDEIHGTLVHCHVNDLLEYEAISYTWPDEHGDATRNRTIFLNDLPLAVTSSCEAVLKRVRLMSAPRVLWIDAVCVNQDDMNERGHQVRLMPEIFSRAKRVLICLGDASEDDNTGIYYYFSAPEPSNPRRRISDKRSIAYGARGQWWDLARNAVRNILAHRYFTRVWILQEIGLAKEAVVIYGKQEIPWKALQQHVVGEDTSMFYGKLSFDFPVFNTPQPLVPKQTQQPMAFNFASAAIRGPSQMLELLDEARHCQASDPRDKVFAFFGLVQLASKFGFVADYTETVAEAFARIAVLLAVRNSLLPVLRRAVRWERQQALPGWVPDWSADSKREPSLTRDKTRLAFGSHIPFLVTSKGYEMDVIGARICDIGTFIYAGFALQMEITGRTPFTCSTDNGLRDVYEALDLPSGTSLGCYIFQSSPSEHYTAESFQAQLQTCIDTQTAIKTLSPDIWPHHQSLPYFVFRESEGEAREFVGLFTLTIASKDAHNAYAWSKGQFSKLGQSWKGIAVSSPLPSHSSKMATHLERTLHRMITEQMGKPGADESDPRPLASRPASVDRQFWMQIWDHFLPTTEGAIDNALPTNDPTIPELLRLSTEYHLLPDKKEMAMPPLSVAEQPDQLRQHRLPLRTCLGVLRLAVWLKRPQTAVDYGRHGQLGGPLGWLDAWAQRELGGLGEVLDTAVGANLAQMALMSPEWKVDVDDDVGDRGDMAGDERRRGPDDKRQSLFKPVVLLGDFLGDEKLEHQRITFALGEKYRR
ncbi:hypothetical protein CHGG_10792 [Chaetomium globosum CBS 148.51]|uniref:Heterokaryon incompatibility domain-containing protein n=1 Tax=Chaetomium globosum (strain ATCC 6205 / CBS 148.51 / DSM 1962 / NBRC 6347 / NRRL 1970) TaxID=306901 RepID=Q2GML2_CHAGB|nr:uncharacterized protein CHGG_10792 [Chaetomium globosum CBS 148.51]EAQ82974.1 hypothetical protein CHGG_10792 [Chaetomium globosum CBS 148.51]